MELTNFGAVMKFALERENEIKGVLERAVKEPTLSAIKGQIEELMKKNSKNISILERSRRESINEMVLEPISGLDSRKHPFPLLPAGDLTATEFDRWVKGSSNSIADFYSDAAGKLPVDEVKRIFERLAKKYKE